MDGRSDGYFIPDSQLSVEFDYTITLAITAQTQAGLTLVEPYVASYPERQLYELRTGCLNQIPSRFPPISPSTAPLMRLVRTAG